MQSDTCTNDLREILGVMGLHDSDIDDADERDSLIAAVERGDVIRESHVGYDSDHEDFLRVIAYIVPGTDTTRYALHRRQGDGLEYIHDSGAPQAVEGAYVEAVWDLSSDCGWTWAETDVPGAPLDGADAELLADDDTDGDDLEEEEDA